MLQTCQELFALVFACLQPVSTNQANVFVFDPPKVLSIFDGFSGPLRLLQGIIKDKRAAKILSLSNEFLTDKARILEPPNIGRVPPMMLGHPSFVFGNSVGGAALENHSLIGRLLRLAPTLSDQRYRDMFKDVTRQTKQAFDSKITEIRSLLNGVRSAAADIVLTTLKAGGVAKERMLEFLVAFAVSNMEATKDRPSHLVAASDGCLLNGCDLLLRLALPILEDPEKLKKVHWDFVHSSIGVALFPPSQSRLYQPNSIQATQEAVGGEFTFISQSFFICWRTLHVGFVPFCRRYLQVLRGLSFYGEGLASGDANAVNYFLMKTLLDIQLFTDDLMRSVVLFCVAAAQKLWDGLSSDSEEERHPAWLIPETAMSKERLSFLQSLPEHFLDDIATMLIFVAKSASNHLHSVNFQGVLSVLVFFLRRPWAIQSPHLRAKLGVLMYHIFLPVAERGHEELYTPLRPSDGAHTQLLASHTTAQRFLAPALLLLYGDVEKTGFYEKLSNRRNIMIILKHLWTLPSHRPAFQGIAMAHDDSSVGEASGVSNLSFVKFANGLLNETNALVATTLDKLSEIRKFQLLKGNNAEWASMDEEQRKMMEERNESNENECKGSAGLCIETLNMLNYLTSDPVIRQPFLLDEILPRFTSCLLSVLNRLVGSKSLELKVDNMDAYNFKPRTMLSEVIAAMTHFSTEEKFFTSVAQDSFFNNGVPLQKALTTVSKHNMVTVEERVAMEQLIERVKVVRTQVIDIDELVADAPSDFFDPILDKLMQDPVLLPTSGMIVDRSTITQHLLNNETGNRSLWI